MRGGGGDTPVGGMGESWGYPAPTRAAPCLLLPAICPGVLRGGMQVSEGCWHWGAGGGGYRHWDGDAGTGVGMQVLGRGMQVPGGKGERDTGTGMEMLALGWACRYWGVVGGGGMQSSEGCWHWGGGQGGGGYRCWDRDSGTGEGGMLTLEGCRHWRVTLALGVRTAKLHFSF